MDNLFAERYGYVKPSESLVVDCMPQEVVNAICNCLFRLQEKISDQYDIIRLVCWTDFFNQKQSMYDKYNDCITRYLEDKRTEWFHKLNLLDFFLKILVRVPYEEEANQFVDEINYDFRRLRYGYRIINYSITPITGDDEIECIEEAMDTANDNIKEHLNRALIHLSDRENPDYRNSVKESLSAVEAFCYNYTKKVTLTDSLKILDKKGVLHNQLKDAFESLYYYSSAKNTGSRHGWAVEDNTFVPTYYEAKFMLVTCSAFINYLKGKFL